MKNVFLSLVLLLFLSSTQAQIVPNDSVSLEANYTNMVYYSLASGTKTSVAADDWHIAVTVQGTQFPNNPMSGTTIRINEAYGVKCYVIPHADASQFSQVIDTTNYNSWWQLHDSDTNLDDGALNSTRNTADPFDFGWGLYNGSSHSVVGDSLFLFEFPDGSVKKLLVVHQVYDTAFDIRVANIDNSDSVQLHISKLAHPNRFFAYVNLLTNQVMEKEPVKTDWDLWFVKYAASDVIPNSHYNTTEVFVKPADSVYKAQGIDVNSNNYQGNAFSSDLNAVGWNWKYYDQGNGVYGVEDSLAYFIKDVSGDVYKIVFTGFGGAANGYTSFYKEKMANASGIENLSGNSSVLLYPNPAANSAHILIAGIQNQAATVRVWNMSGQLMNETQTNEQNITLDTSTLPNGMYTLSISNGQLTARKPLVIQH